MPAPHDSHKFVAHPNQKKAVLLGGNYSVELKKMSRGVKIERSKCRRASDTKQLLL